MKINIERLRRFCDEAEASHSALAAATDRMRKAKREVEDAERHLDACRAAMPHPGGHQPKSRTISDTATLDRAETAVSRAKDAYSAARAARERAAEIHARQSALANSGRNLAERMSILPEDLRAW